jgi:nucleoside-diphosphate-sugar epimerase
MAWEPLDEEELGTSFLANCGKFSWFQYSSSGRYLMGYLDRVLSLTYIFKNSVYTGDESMNVLVTGAAGYIGSQLTEILVNAGHDVVCLDRFFFGRDSLKQLDGRVRILEDDIRWFDSALLDGIDAVLDLASISNDPSGELDPRKTLEINYEGRVRVASLAKKRSVKKYVLASSCSVYGASEGVSDEASPLNPLTTYARASVLAEQEILRMADSKFHPTALRQATVYGLSKRMRFDLAINAMVRSFYKDRKVKIMRDGSQWRPFVHVKDTSRAFLKILEADADLVGGSVYNVGSDEQNYQILQLARTVAQAVGLPFQYEWYGSPDSRNYRVSFEKIRRELNFRGELTPSEGARETYEALRKGELDGDDPRCVTVEWYRTLLSSPELAKKVELNGVVL